MTLYYSVFFGPALLTAVLVGVVGLIRRWPPRRSLLRGCASAVVVGISWDTAFGAFGWPVDWRPAVFFALLQVLLGAAALGATIAVSRLVRRT